MGDILRKTNLDELPERIAHDIWYIEHWTFLLDLKMFFYLEACRLGIIVRVKKVI